MSRSTIHLYPLFHRGEAQVKLDFPYDESIKIHLKKMEGVRWSQTNRCFYIGRSHDSIGRLMDHCKTARIWVDVTTLGGSGLESQAGKTLPADDSLPVKTSEEDDFYENGEWSLSPDDMAWLAAQAERPTQRVNSPSDAMQDSSLPRNAQKARTRTTQFSSRAAKKKRVEFPEGLQERLTKYQAFLEQRRYAYSTVKTYLGLVRQFFAAHPGKDWNAFNRQDIAVYNHSAFIAKGKSYSTQNQFINAIKLFYQVHDIKGLVPDEIERPRKRKHLPEVLTKEEVGRLLSGVGNLKHRTILSLVYACGLRIGEALALRPADLRLNERLLYVRGAKGHKDRRVPLAGKIVALLEQYQKAYPSQEYLFEGQKGGPYSYTSARKVMKRAVAKAGLPSKVSLHTLRHSYATHLLQSGTDLRYIQEILGHADPKTTMLYTHVAANDLKNIKSPFDELGI